MIGGWLLWLAVLMSFMLVGCTARLQTKDCHAEIHYLPGQNETIEAGDCRLTIE